MDLAGLKPYERVLMDDVNDLYRLLINNQGKRVLIPVLRNKDEILIRVLVPELDVPLKGISFLY